QGGEDAHGGGFAGAVRPQKRQHGAALHGEVYPAQNVVFTVRFLEAFDLNGEFGHDSYCNRRWSDYFSDEGKPMRKPRVLPAGSSIWAMVSPPPTSLGGCTTLAPAAVSSLRAASRSSTST